MKKLLLIGKNSFVAKNIYLYLKKFIKLKKLIIYHLKIKKKN